MQKKLSVHIRYKPTIAGKRLSTASKFSVVVVICSTFLACVSGNAKSFTCNWESLRTLPIKKFEKRFSRCPVDDRINITKERYFDRRPPTSTVLWTLAKSGDTEELIEAIVSRIENITTPDDRAFIDELIFTLVLMQDYDINQVSSNKLIMERLRNAISNITELSSKYFAELEMVQLDPTFQPTITEQEALDEYLKETK